MSKPGKDIRKLETNIPDEHQCKNIQNTSKTTSMTHEKNYLLWPNGIYSWDVSLFKICKSISVTMSVWLYYQNKRKNSHDNLNRYRTIWQNAFCFSTYDKFCQQSSNRMNIFQCLINAIFQKLTNIIGEKNVFLLKFCTR